MHDGANGMRYTTKKKEEKKRGGGTIKLFIEIIFQEPTSGRLNDVSVNYGLKIRLVLLDEPLCQGQALQVFFFFPQWGMRSSPSFNMPEEWSKPATMSTIFGT